MMTRLDEGMEMPDLGVFPTGTPEPDTLLLLKEGRSTAFLNDPDRCNAELEKAGIVMGVLRDAGMTFAGSFLKIAVDPEQSVLKQYTDADHLGVLILLDDSRRIQYVNYYAHAAEIPNLSEMIKLIENIRHPALTRELLENILDAYPYEIVYADRHHVVRYMNAAARRRYGGRVKIGRSLFNCHNERSREKIISFLKRADAGENEMFETYNQKTGEREFFVPVRNQAGKVTGYFERHEAPWDREHAQEPAGDYWKHRV